MLSLPRGKGVRIDLSRGILDGLSLDVATPDEARDMLGLKGGDRVAF